VTRIVAGTLGGRRLTAPAGQQTRPTSERVREALFSTIGSMTDLDGCRFADLYAGSGAVGLEAASRGAAAVLLVESEARAARTLRENVAALGLAAICQLSTARVATALATGPAEPFDVVFADPPYQVDDDDIAAMLSALVDNGWLAGDAVVVVERSTRSAQPRWPEGVTPERGRRYGDTALWYGRRS
jgi:16S rRNA (guanine966-N2)-methyltransferase